MPTPVWARPPFVLSALFVYLAVHFAVRMAMWHTLGIDDSEQAVFAQHFLWSYRNSAPPLFTWLLLGLGGVMGVNIVSISLLRYALLAILYVFTYLTARRLIADPRLSALSVYSFAAIYVFAFYSHHDLTHTTVMATMLPVAWYVFARLAQSPKLGWYIALGASFGLGLLGKWNFVMFAAALPLACLVVPRYRRLVLTWKLVPAMAACALVALPTVATVLLAGPPDQDTFGSVLLGDSAPYLTRVVQGILRLAESILVYPQPLLPLLVLVFALPLWRGLRRAGAPDEETRALDVRFVGWTIAISVALHLVLVLVFGARELSERLMQPPLFILPIFLFMLIERGRPARLAVNAFAVLMAVLATGTLAARIVVYARGADHCGSCRAMMPVEALADQLRAAGYKGGGTILSSGFHIGGNMRVPFPDARLVDAPFPPSMWPAPKGEGQCLLLWQAKGDEGLDEGRLRFLLGYLADRLHGNVDAPHEQGVASALMYGSQTRLYRMGYRLYDAPVGDCR